NSMSKEQLQIPSNEQLAALNDKIREGSYREVYRNKNLAIKKLKKHVIKSVGSVKIRIPTRVYLLFRFGISDINKYERKWYDHIISKAPPEMHRCFAEVLAVKKVNGFSYSINQLVLDADNQPSKTLVQHGKIESSSFWKKIEELEQFFKKHSIPYFTIGGYNICVQRQQDGSCFPVLIDYKRIGIRTFWHQLPLYLKHFRDLKMERRFQKMRDQLKGSGKE
ncbi:MAG: hypothetical protein OSB65_18840, partial [Roseibacillus sp.]|nr:hypothetical protein [Roseibacillus sp.]